MSLCDLDDNNNEFIYLIKEREFIKTKEPIYKIGKTKQENLQRIKSYPNGSILLLYIITNDCDKKDEYILGIKYTQSALSKLFINVIYKIYNIKINANLIRILYATYLRSLNLSGKDWEEKAKKMGHSLGENIKYSYVPKKDN